MLQLAIERAGGSWRCFHLRSCRKGKAKPCCSLLGEAPFVIGQAAFENVLAFYPFYWVLQDTIVFKEILFTELITEGEGDGLSKHSAPHTEGK